MLSVGIDGYNIIISFLNGQVKSLSYGITFAPVNLVCNNFQGTIDENDITEDLCRPVGRSVVDNNDILSEFTYSVYYFFKC